MSDEVAGLVAGGSNGLEALKGRIMAEIESKLVLKEEALWKRGQVEITKLKQEHQQVRVSVDQLQDKQASLLNENQKIRGALVEVTSRFERVVKEMREVLQVLQHQGAAMNHTERLAQHLSPSPSVASTSASEVAEQPYETPGSTIGTELTPGPMTGSADRSQQQTPSSPVDQNTETSGLEGSPPPLTEDTTGESKTFCTPPRMPGMPSSAEDISRLHADTSAAWCLPTPTPSPAVLSLASALPSASAVSLTPNPSPTSAKDDNSPPHRQRLALAECLERQGTGTFTTPTSDAGVAGTPPSARPTDATPTTSNSLAAGSSGFIRIELIKEQGFVTLGMEVNQIDTSSLRVESVDEHGLVGRHNARQDSDATRVKEGDRIVEVNSVMHDPALMLHECKVQQRLVFKLQRELSLCPALLSTPMKAGAIPGIVNSSDVSEDRTVLAADEEQQQQECKLLSSPVATKMRPEASIFVPSAQKSVVHHPPQHQEMPMHIPPGLEGYDTSVVHQLQQPLLALPALSPTTFSPAAAVAALRNPAMTAQSLLPPVGAMLAPTLAAPLAQQHVPMMMEMRDAVASPTAPAYDDEEVKRALFP